MKDNVDLAYPCKPDFFQAAKRVDAWLSGAIIDRVPVNFRLPEIKMPLGVNQSIEDAWMDSEANISSFVKSIDGRQLHGETFPIFCPNLGPWISSVVWQGKLVFEETTSYMEKPGFDSYVDISNDFQVDFTGIYFQKIIEMTQLSLETGQGIFQTGYTDLHGGLDCLAGLRGTEVLLTDFYDFPEEVLRAQGLVTRGFLRMFDFFSTWLEKSGQLSANWLNLPFPGRMHVPSCDTAYMMSPEQFTTFEVPSLMSEMAAMDVNIFHVDGIGVARHIDTILELPGLDAIQWVQGSGDDEPISKWTGLIKKILNKGISVIAILNPAEIEGFISDFPNPEGILIHVNESLSEDDEITLLERIHRW